MLFGSAPHGTHRSVPISSKPGGITPTMEPDVPPTRIVLLRMSGLPPNRVCHKRWLMIATGGSVRRELRVGEAASQNGAHAENRERIVEQERREHALGHVAAG